MLGIDNVFWFDFIILFLVELMVRVFELFYLFGVLDEYFKLIKFLGLRMVELVVEFMMSKIFFLVFFFGCLSEILMIVVMISVGGMIWI